MGQMGVTKRGRLEHLLFCSLEAKNGTFCSCACLLLHSAMFREFREFRVSDGWRKKSSKERRSDSSQCRGMGENGKMVHEKELLQTTKNPPVQAMLLQPYLQEPAWSVQTVSKVVGRAICKLSTFPAEV